MSTKNYVEDGQIVKVDSTVVVTDANSIKDFYNKDFGTLTPTDSYGYLAELPDCSSVGFVTASYKAVAGEFTISTDNTVAPSYSSTNKRFKLIKDGIVIVDVTQTTDFSHTLTGLSKLEDTTFTALNVVLVVSSFDNKQGCAFGYKIDTLERDTILLSNVDRLFTVTYNPINTLIDSSLVGVTADWSINPYPDPIQQLPSHLLSYDLTENFLKTLTSVDTISFEVKVLGKSLGSDGSITIKANLYTVSPIYNTVINGYVKYLNISTVGTAPFVLLFIDNVLLPESHINAVTASGKTLQMMVLDSQVDVDYFTTKGTVDVGDITRYISIVESTIPTTTIDVEAYDLIDGLVNGVYVNSSNPIKSEPVPSFDTPLGVTVAELDGDVGSLINSTVSLVSVDTIQDFRIHGNQAVEGELTTITTLQRNGANTTTISANNLGLHIEELVDSEIVIPIKAMTDLISLLDPAHYPSSSVVTFYLTEQLTDGGLLLKNENRDDDITYNIQIDPLYFVEHISLQYEVYGVLSREPVSQTTTTIYAASGDIFNSPTIVKQSSAELTTTKEMVTQNFSGSSSTLVSEYSQQQDSVIFVQADNVDGIRLKFNGIGGVVLNNLKILIKKKV